MSNRPDSYNRLTKNDLCNIIELCNEHKGNYSLVSRITGIPRKTISNFMWRNTHRKFWKKYDKANVDVDSTPRFTLNELLASLPEDYNPSYDNDNVGLKIVVIPDTQVKPESDIRHIIAAGKYIQEHRPDVVVVIGDWWDCPSLNRFGSRLDLDGRRIQADLNAGYGAIQAFLGQFYNVDGYEPRLVFTIGNHDPMVRIPRLVSEHPHLDGFIQDNSKEWLEDRGFEVYDFLEPVNIGGIRFCHYFQNPHSAKRAPLSGQIDTMIKNAGFSFVAGHTQGIKIGKHYLSDGTQRIGIIAGSFYTHEEDFLGRQGQNHWHGIIQLNEVKDGGADICEISLNYLMRTYCKTE